MALGRAGTSQAKWETERARALPRKPRTREALLLSHCCLGRNRTRLPPLRWDRPGTCSVHAAQAPGPQAEAGAGARDGRARLHSPRWPGCSSHPHPRPPLPRAAVRPWLPEGGSAVLIPPLAAAVPSCWRRRHSGRRAAAGARRPPQRPARARVTHVESGVLRAEEREEHGERPQSGAAVVLLGGDGIAALRAERVEVLEGHRAAHPARPEPQGRGQEQRPGGAARHRLGSAGGDGVGTQLGHSGTERDAAGTELDGAGAERRRGEDAAGTERGFAVTAGQERGCGAEWPAGPGGVREARTRGFWAPRPARIRRPRSGSLLQRKVPGGTALEPDPPLGPRFKYPAGRSLGPGRGRGGAMQIRRLLKRQAGQEAQPNAPRPRGLPPCALPELPGAGPASSSPAGPQRQAGLGHEALPDRP